MIKQELTMVSLVQIHIYVFPIKEVADIGRKKGIPLIIDNTASPVICKL